MIRTIQIILIAVILQPQGPAAAEGRPPWVASGRSAMVASDSPEASRAGLEILQNGGNAFDAATAVSFALGVTRPYSTGPGGGGFAIARKADGELLVLDYRESAPAAARPDMFVVAAARQTPTAVRPSRAGGLAVGVPGMVAGQHRLLSTYGTLPLARVLEPAIRLARDGFVIDAHYRAAAAKVRSLFEADPTLKTRCALVYNLHLNGGRPHPPGARLKQPQLARFLERLAGEGPDFVYRGAFAREAVAALKRDGGIIAAADFLNYRVRARAPLIGTYRGHTLVTMPPPSSGGVALIQTLNILEPLNLPAVYREHPADARHWIVEAMKHAFANRARWFGDDDFVEVPTELMIAKSYAAGLSKTLQRRSASRPQDCGSTQLPEDGGTSHYCIVDPLGNVVAGTETINTQFGALLAVDDWGVILNNEMDDFSAEPGRPNAFGLTQSPQNAVAPGKRPLSSMCPTLVLSDGQVRLVLGASGGPRIISSVLQVVLNVLDFDMPLPEAVQANRLHHQWQPDTIFFDRPPAAGVVADLRARGHQVADHTRQGVVQAVVKQDDLWIGVSDPRKGGRPAGY